MLHFVHGGLTVACIGVALFFSRFHRASGDRLFALFSGAFAVLALHWGLLGSIPSASEHRPLIYVLRLIAFMLILAAIADKNRRR